MLSVTVARTSFWNSEAAPSKGTILAMGFPLLTLGVIAGGFWVEQESGRIWTGTAHEVWSVIAWAVYAVVVTVRFTARQGARQAAVSAVGGFLFLFFAVIGLGLFA